MVVLTHYMCVQIHVGVVDHTHILQLRGEAVVSSYCSLPGDGLLVSNGPKWARNRRLLTPAFHYEILKPYIDVYNSCSEVLLVTCCYGDKLVMGWWH